MLKGVVARAKEHVQAQDTLEKRGDGESDVLLRLGSQREPDHLVLSSEEQLLGVSQHSIIAAMRRTPLVLAATIALATPSLAWADARLIASVGLHNAFTISMSTPNGKAVRSIPAGTYTIIVHDYSSIHDFALGSQTENRRLFTTGVRFVGTRTYTVKLTPGKYAYACSAHPYTMNGTFVVSGG
jgi:hypothetical protein